MATQDDTRIPLSLVAETDRRHFRLLELPPELLSLLTSANPPRLELKASEALDDGEGGHTVLCTQDGSFELRQKNSSNTVYLLEPQKPQSDGIPVPALRAIAQVHSTLELAKANVEWLEAWAMIRSVLPEHLRGDQSRAPKDKRALFAQLPYHQTLCEQVFLDVGAFEHPDTGLVFRSDPTLLWTMWRAAMTTADLRSVKLDRPFSVERVTGSDDPTGTLAQLSFVESFSTTDLETGLTTLDPERCVDALGRVLLEHKAGNQDINQKALLEEWKDLLPEAWRELTNISRLSQMSQVSEDGKSIRFKDPSGDAATTATAGGAAGKKRKWHEKFRPQKK